MQKDSTLEAKLSLVREFQQFAESEGMVFEFQYDTLFGTCHGECYRSYENRDMPVYLLSTAKRTCFPDRQIISIVQNKTTLKKFLKSYQEMKDKDPDLEHYIIKLHSYFALAKNLLRPAHLRQNPAQLVSTVAHEGLHATVFHYGYRKIHSNPRLEESLAEASGYILLKEFGKATTNPLMGAQLVKEQLTEMRRTHNALSRWLSTFRAFYGDANTLNREEFEKKRAGMFAQMERNFRKIISNPLYLEAFDFGLNEGFNNAALAFFTSYGAYFKALVDFYERCDNFGDFLKQVNKLPGNFQ